MKKNSIDLLEIAIGIAVEAHKGQIDKAGEPYILHPLHIMSRFDELDLKIVSILHDVFEDTSYPIESLGKQGFPTHLIDALNALTHLKNETYEDYLIRVKSNEIALSVKMEDIMHNLNITRIRKGSNNRATIIRLVNKYLDALEFLEQA